MEQDEQPAASGIFRWDTLTGVGPHELRYKSPVQGKECEVELVNGDRIRVWRAEDGQQYFCHGLTFGGKDAPDGPVSPFSGKPVETILQGLYDRVEDETEAKPGDIAVWKGLPPNTTPHSAILTEVTVSEGRGYLDEDGTRLQTKNGIEPEQELTLLELFAIYGESYNIYRRKA